MVLGIIKRGWARLRVMPLGGWNPFYSPSRHLYDTMEYLGAKVAEGMASGLRKAEEREREIGRLPEPERGAVREAEFRALAERVRCHAAEHLAGLPWFANPYLAEFLEEGEEREVVDGDEEDPRD